MITEADELAREMLVVVPAVMSTIRAEMRKRRRSDLNVIQFRTLVYLKLSPGADLSSLAEYLGLTLPTVSQMIDGLVEKGVVTRQDSTTDRRRVALALTAQGVSLLERSLSGTRAHLVEILSRLKPEEVAAIHKAFLLMDTLFCQPPDFLPKEGN